MDTPETKGPVVTLGSVELSTARVAELQDGRPVVQVAREELAQLTVRLGPAAERPLLTAVLGLFLVVLGLFGLVYCIAALGNPSGSIKAGAYLTPFGLLGLWLVRYATRRRLYLEARTRSDRRKLVFQGKVSPDDAKVFVNEAARRLHYAIALEDRVERLALAQRQERKAMTRADPD